MEHIFIWYIEGGYSEPRMSSLSDGRTVDTFEDDDEIIEYVTEHWAADDDVVLSIATGKRYAERTIYNNRAWGIDG